MSLRSQGSALSLLGELKGSPRAIAGLMTIVRPELSQLSIGPLKAGCDPFKIPSLKDAE